MGKTTAKKVKAMNKMAKAMKSHEKAESKTVKMAEKRMKK